MVNILWRGGIAISPISIGRKGYMYTNKKMDLKDKRISRLQNEINKLKEENKKLKSEKEHLEEEINIFNQKLTIADEARLEFDDQMGELMSIKYEYTKALNEALALKKEYKDLFKQLTLKFRAER